jgi:hypothetical protein
MVKLKTMNNDMIERWETMLASLNAAKKSSVICSEAEIKRVEKELGFEFPIGYKEYCRVFGSGSLGQGDAPDFFRVYCPCCPPSSVDIRQTGHNLIGLKLDVKASEPIEDPDKAELLYRLLENGYAFADSDSADKFMWDLTTYSEEDQSYDIYWIPDEEAEAITFVGRDFFEFIDKFCLGAKWKMMFPEEYFTDSPVTQGRFFKAFEQHDENRSPDSFTESILENFWEDLVSNKLLTGKAELKLNCGYGAPSKKQAECLQRVWSQEEGTVIEVIAPSERPNIPRLLEITVTVAEGQLNREFVESLLRKMIRIGKECNCSLTSYGSSIRPENQEVSTTDET